MNSFILIGFFLLMGVVVKTLNWLPEQAPLRLNQLVIFVILPAVILLRAPQLTLNQSILLPMCLPWLLIGCSAAVVLFLSRQFSWSREITGALMMVVPLGNTSYLGFPMILAFMGQAGMPYAIVYDQIGNFFGLAIYGTIVISHYASPSNSNKNAYAAVQFIIKKILSFPPFLALLLALSLKLFTDLDQYPEMLDQLLMIFAKAMTPLTMFIVGLQFHLRLPRRYVLPLVFGLSIKLLLMPLLAALVCIGLNQAGLISNKLLVQVCIFEAAMPPMVTAGVLAIAANLAPRLAAACVGLGLLFSLPTLTLTYWLLDLV